MRDRRMGIPRQRETLSAEDRADLIIYGRRWSDAPLRRLCQCCGLEEAVVLVYNLIGSQPLEVCADCSEADVNAIHRAAKRAVGAA